MVGPEGGNWGGVRTDGGLMLERAIMAPTSEK
jgi:hypothetical protein